MACAKQYYEELDEDGNTPLHAVAARNQICDVKKLLDIGVCKVDPENMLGWTPLMMAARNGHLEIVRLLIEHKADATRRNAYGASVFLMSIASGKIDLVSFVLQHLLHGGVSKQSMESVISPYMIALLFEHSNIFNYLVANSFNVNASAPSTGITPVIFATMRKDTYFLNMLISSGADLYAKNVNNQSASDIINSQVAKSSQNRNCLDVEDRRHHQKRQKFNQKKEEQQTQQAQQESVTTIKHQIARINEYLRQGHEDPGITSHDLNHHHQHCHHPDQPVETIHIPHFYSPQMHRPVPMIYLSPQPTFINPPSNEMHQKLRKSSGVASSWCLVSPSFSPIMPNVNFSPQMFFPSDFNAPAVMSPVDVCAWHGNNSMLNHNVFQSPTNIVGYFSYGTDNESPHA